MQLCNYCGERIISNAKFCSHCGKVNVVSSSSNNNGSETAKPINEKPKIQKTKSSKYKFIKIFAFCLVVILGAFYYYSNYMTLESKAENAVSGYLKAIKNGTSTYNYKVVDAGVDDFINVLDYKFLNAGDPSKGDVVVTESKRTWQVEKDYQTNDELYGNSFEEFKRNVKTYYAQNVVKIISESDSQIKYTITTGDKYDIINLLYDVQVTNGLGQAVYKKVNFTVGNDNNEKKFKVMGIHYN